MDNSFWGSIIIALISSGTVAAIVSAVQKRIINGDPKNLALRLLLQDKLTFLMEREIGKGYTTRETHKIIHEMYVSYKSLGGNGDMEWLKGEYDKIPLQVNKKAGV